MVSNDVTEKVGYHNYFQVGTHEAAKLVTEACPDGWRGTAASAGSEQLILDELQKIDCAFRVGQVKVHSGDHGYPLYAFNIEAMAEMHAKYKVEYGIGCKAVLVLRNNPDAPQSRTEVIRLRITTEERDRIQHAASDAGQTLSAYIRDRALPSP